MERLPECLVARLAGAEQDERGVDRRQFARRGRPAGRIPSDRPSATPCRPPAARSTSARRRGSSIASSSASLRRALVRQRAGAVGLRAGADPARGSTRRCRSRSGSRRGACRAGARMPSKPKPNSGVWISLAYRGLTVVIHSLKLMPAFRKLTLPQNSMPFDAEQVPAEIERGHPDRRKQPLVGQVVDGEHPARPAQRRPTGEHRLQVDGRQARLPVVRVHDVGRPVGSRRELQRRPRQHGEPDGVVGIVDRRRSRRGRAGRTARDSRPAPPGRDRRARARRTARRTSGRPSGPRPAPVRCR